MTYSQWSRRFGDESELQYLEEQITAVKRELTRAQEAGQQEALDEARRRLAELEAELEKLED